MFPGLKGGCDQSPFPCGPQVWWFGVTTLANQSGGLSPSPKEGWPGWLWKSSGDTGVPHPGMGHTGSLVCSPGLWAVGNSTMGSGWSFGHLVGAWVINHPHEDPRTKMLSCYAHSPEFTMHV